MVSERTRVTKAAYQRKHYKQVAIRWKIDFVEELNEAAKEAGIPLAQYVKEAIEMRMARDKGEE